MVLRQYDIAKQSALSNPVEAALSVDMKQTSFTQSGKGNAAGGEKGGGGARGRMDAACSTLASVWGCEGTGAELGQGGVGGGGSGTLVHAEQQLHSHSDACVPAQWEQPDVAGNDGWAQ
ncbi:hypothetical protein JZ751_029220 [Albula glossodonta]|uniref:Uncharacterized protein n=1 Tax=Albula glossodonta TaxID=121402 RepID=A0A8T2P5W7_9TELE|nr:hypothetical protein JZ751_029220 [Albula glossodonta]